jgi:class 3 adenylate cyclase
MPSEVEHKLAAILSADIVGYSRLMAEDEDETVRRLGAYRTEITNLVADHRGCVVDFTGDNFLAEFPTATDAVESAAEIQRVLKARNAAVPAQRAIPSATADETHCGSGWPRSVPGDDSRADIPRLPPWRCEAHLLS